MKRALVDLCQASVSFQTEGKGYSTVLHTTDFTLYAGEHCVLYGANGAGKSTFLRLLRGDVWADTDRSVIWHSRNGKEYSPIVGRSMASLVSTAQQELYTRHAWQLTGEDILLTAFFDTALLYSVAEKQQRETVRAMAQRLACTALLSHTANTLSQGQLRLLLLGRALLQCPEILLLDEYLDGLDIATRQHILTILEDIAPHTTIIITTHRLNTVPSWIKRQLYMQEGRLVDSIPSAKNTHLLYKTTVEEKHDTVLTSVISTEQNISTPLIALYNATVFIERVAVLHSITWSMHKGEHWRIHGANGAGKSTFLSLLAGDAYPADGGTITRCLPRHGGKIHDLETIRRAIRLVSDKEQATYGYDLLAHEFVLSGCDNVVGQYREYTEAECTQAHNLLHTMHLSSLVDRRIRTLSTGQLRRLLLARALMNSPEIVLLDEPFSGLDISSQHQMFDILCGLSHKLHFVLVSHYAEDKLPIINREACLEKGYLIK